MNEEAHDCQATLIAAPGSGQGKTLFTAALARHLVRQGKQVKVFKVGPDYLDPMILQAASGQTVFNLDWWMAGEQECLARVSRAASSADVILVEGLMGLYDNEPSNAWLAKRLNMPVTLVMDMAKYAQTAAAVVHGMQQYDPTLRLASIVGNRLGSQHHQTLVREAMADSVPYAGSLRRDDRMVLPERYLGLVQAQELERLSETLDAAADYLDECDLDLNLMSYKPPHFDAGGDTGRLLEGKTIAVAIDQAFAFVYPANIDWLQHQGAELVPFSPLANQPVPACDALWLPGGYPELHRQTLSANRTSLDSIADLIRQGLPGLAECGGMMLLAKTITSLENESSEMAGVLDAGFTMQKRFQSVGYQYLANGHEILRGHSFHHSNMTTGQSEVARWKKRDNSIGEAVYRQQNMLMTYAHSYFGSCPSLVARIFNGVF